MGTTFRGLVASVVVALVIGAGGALASCGGNNGGSDGGGGDGSDSGITYAEGGTNYCANPDGGCPMFPPIGTKECDPQTLGPPTLVYPTDGLLLPPNMNVLEVQFIPPMGATLYEVDFLNNITNVGVVDVCEQVPDVRKGMSRGCGVTLPQAAWNDVANKNRDGDSVTIIVRATANGQCVSTSKQSIKINFAKEDLAGGIYYWQSAVFGGIGGKTGGIYSHDFGTFDPKPTPFYIAGNVGTCVGCHTLSRDGARIVLETDDPDGDDEFGDVKTHAIMDVASKANVGMIAAGPGFQTFTHDHSKMIASTFKSAKNAKFEVYDGNTSALITSMALPVNMTGTQPDLSRDDAHLVFTVPSAMTIAMQGDDHFTAGSVYFADFNVMSNTLGTPQAALSASGTDTYYYPSFSPDGAFLVLNHAGDNSAMNANNDAFYNRKARVQLLHFPPMQGDMPIDLGALNVADGLTNSWPRWSPFVQTYKGHKLLWVTFSSNRDYGLHLVNKGFDHCFPPEGPMYDQPQPLSKMNTTYENCEQPQIWMAGVIVDPDRNMDTQDRSFPAFWLPFQDVNSHNHSAQWVEKVAPPMGCGDGGACNSGEVCCNGTCAPSCVN
jgi:hypothetical protein